jgi:hypothetical protein
MTELHLAQLDRLRQELGQTPPPSVDREPMRHAAFAIEHVTTFTGKSGFDLPLAVGISELTFLHEENIEGILPLAESGTA